MSLESQFTWGKKIRQTHGHKRQRKKHQADLSLHSQSHVTVTQPCHKAMWCCSMASASAREFGKDDHFRWTIIQPKHSIKITKSSAQDYIRYCFITNSELRLNPLKVLIRTQEIQLLP